MRTCTWGRSVGLTGQVELRLEGRRVVLERNAAGIEWALELAGCYVVVSDVSGRN
jgi:hypothetical protein